MRVLIDEDTAVQLLQPLRHLLPQHTVDHIGTLNWKGKKDRRVYADAKAAGYDVIITRDSNQLSDPDECSAIKRAGIHHVRYSQKRKGMPGLGLALGAVIAAMPLVMEELDQVGGQRLIHVVGLEPGRRYDAIDPAKNPPNYWPR
jgi:hypothetical protein